MTIPEDFKTRLKIAKSKIKKQIENDGEKVNSSKIERAFGGSRQYHKHLEECRILMEMHNIYLRD